MNLNAFFEKYYNGYSKHRQKILTHFIKNIEDALNAEKEICKNNNEIFNESNHLAILLSSHASLVFFCKINSTNRMTYIASEEFISLKLVIFDFIEWLKDEQIFDESKYNLCKTYITNLSFDDIILFDEDDFYYYGSIEDIIHLINEVGEYFFSNSEFKKKPIYSPVTDLLTIKCFCIFLWHGFELEELPIIQSDSIITEFGKYYIKKNTKKIEISYQEYIILKTYIGSNRQRALPNGRIMIWENNDEYFFKKRKNKCLTSNAIRQYFKSYNNYARAYREDSCLIVTKIKQSSFFDEIYKYSNGYFEKAKQKIEKEKEHFNTYAKRKYIALYAKWLKLFHSESV